MYTVVFGHMEGNILAATGIIGPIMDVMFFVVWGFNSAAAIILGNKMGAGEGEKVYYYARIMMRLMLVISICMMIIILVFRVNLVNLFDIEDSLKVTVVDLLVIYALSIPMKVMNMLIILGILRPGGDTKFCLYLELLSLWMVGVPLCAFCGLVLKLDTKWVYMTIFSDELVKIVIGVPRVYSKKWINRLTM